MPNRENSEIAESEVNTESDSELESQSAGDNPAQAGPEMDNQNSESNDANVELTEVDQLRQEIEVLKQKADENFDLAMRAQAELENVRKRSSRDIENAHKYALDRFTNDLLPVLDSMELGISASENAEDVESIREGMDLTLTKFIDTLAKFGVVPIDPQGEKFDPEMHEAVTMQELEGAESGTIITVMQKGYALNGRLVRPAMVVVAK